MHIPVSSVIVISTVIVITGILLFYRPLIYSSSWQALITPLASIMGSGFLVCAPLLYANTGNYAIFAMIALLVLAYAVGSVIRFNIQYGEVFLENHISKPDNPREEHRLHVAHRNAVHSVRAGEISALLEKLSHVVLAGAYCISVSYYLQLLASFTFQSILSSHEWYGKMLVTVILSGIALIGTMKGLKGIERVERTVVSINLAMITALLAGLIYHNCILAVNGTWTLHRIPVPQDRLHIFRVLMGMLIIVQGFETSRFLGSEHPREQRIRTMKLAQIISSSIYILFIALMAVVINNADSGHDSGITAIINLSNIISPVLPIMITITAIGSQFSASTADDAGCSGLIEAFFKGKKFSGFNYISVTVVAVTLTWLTDVYRIISYASQAFAFYYALQCVVGALILKKVPSVRPQKLKAFMFWTLAIICILITVYGIPAG